MGREVTFRRQAIRGAGIALLLGISAVVARSQVTQMHLDEEAARLRRLKQMTQLVDDVILETCEMPSRVLTRLEHPVLRYTNPVTAEFGEGVLFLWLDGKRPLAAVSLIWEPPSCSCISREFPGAPAAAKSASARLTQLRALARRFQVREERRGQWQDGRLLTQPLYRWEDAAAGIVDGALFGFAETTDPEILLLIEARRETDMEEAKWYFSLGKMTASPMTVNLDAQQIWSVGGYWRNPRTPQDPYVEAQVAAIRDGRVEYTQRIPMTQSK
jgi:hypothetical protein